MNDGVEQLLEIDAFGQAVGSNSNRRSASAMSSTCARRSSEVSAPVTVSMRSFGKALQRPAAT
jgi:hypothetical protein